MLSFVFNAFIIFITLFKHSITWFLYYCNGFSFFSRNTVAKYCETYFVNFIINYINFSFAVFSVVEKAFNICSYALIEIALFCLMIVNYF